MDITDIVLSINPNAGTFLEIGCWDGEHLSNTSKLEAKGWEGVCVDPFPKNFANRQCKIVHKAISKDGKPREFVKVYYDKRDNGDVSYLSGFVDSIRFHLELITKHCHYEIIKVKTLTIHQLYATYNIPPNVEFLSLDTEGSELEILKSINFDKYSYNVICVEHNDVIEVKNEIREFMYLKCYRLYKEIELNDIFINEDLL